MSIYKISDIEIGDGVYFNLDGQKNYDLYWTVISKKDDSLEIKIEEMGESDNIWLDVKNVYRVEKRNKQIKTKMLNEWGFAAAVDEQLKSTNEATFTILPETTNILSDLVVKDVENFIYKIQDTEAQMLHTHLLRDRNLKQEVDHVKKTITYKYQDSR